MIVRAHPATLPLALDRTSPVPLYHQLIEQFTAAIDDGLLKPGDTLEREDHLAERLNISRPTLRRALIDLAARGLIVRARGVGTMVTRPEESSEPAPSKGSRPTSGPAGRGLARTQVVRLDPDHFDPKVAKELGLAEPSLLIYVEQLLVIDGGPLSLRRTWLPTALINPAHADLAAVPPRRILSEAGHRVASERRTFGYRLADRAERAALGLQASDQVFTVCGLSLDLKGAPVERTTHTYRREIDQYAALLATG